MTAEEFMHEYEMKTNMHNFQHVTPFIAEDATYWFIDGSFQGIDEIGQAFERTWNVIQNEQYRIENVQWLIAEENAAVCTYRFHWQGIVAGEDARGDGRGTSVLAKISGQWKVLHEHLSVEPHLASNARN